MKPHWKIAGVGALVYLWFDFTEGLNSLMLSLWGFTVEVLAPLALVAIVMYAIYAGFLTPHGI